MAEDLVTLAQVRTHLRLDAGDDEQDEYLRTLMAAALRAIERYTGKLVVATWPTIEEDDRVLVTQAALLMVGHWFVHREAAAEMPPAIGFLLRPLKRYTL